MKKSLLLTILAVGITAIVSRAAEDGSVYVVPVNADGTATVNADGSYSGQVVMTAAEGQPGLTATHVRLAHGFVFLAVNGDASKHTFYTLRGDEVSFDTKNPLMIETDLSRHINVPAGVYDITFYSSTGSGSSFAITAHTSTGAYNITADADVPAVYYDLQGRRIDGTPAPGLYIARSGEKVAKVYIP